MSPSRMTIGLSLPPMPPLGVSQALTYVARLSRLDSLLVWDHWQGLIPTALWEQLFGWAATFCESPHALFDYQVFLGSLAKSAGRLRIGVGVTDPIRRHPVLLAQAMLTLAHLSKRPPILGIGPGNGRTSSPTGWTSPSRSAG